MIILTMTTTDIMVILGVPTLIGMIVKTLYDVATGKYKKAREELKMNRKALQAILRDKLRQHYLYYIEEGSITIEDKQNYENLYTIYHNMGKNGVMNEMYDQIMALPISNTPAYEKRKKDK